MNSFLLSFNIFLFLGWFFALGWKISFTDYKVANAKDVMQLIFGFLVVLLFWITDQFFLELGHPTGLYWKIGAVLGFFTFGWVNVLLLLLIVEKTATVIESKINKKTSEMVTTETETIITKPKA